MGQRNNKKCDHSSSNLSPASLRLWLYNKFKSDKTFFTDITFVSILKPVALSTREKWHRQLACQPASIFQHP